MAPVPDAKPGNAPGTSDGEMPPDAIPAPKGDPQAAAPATKPPGPVQGPPMPEPKPSVPADGAPADAGTALPENVDAVPVPELNPRATPEDEEPSQRPAGPVQGPPMPPALEASPQDETAPETVPIPEPNPRTAPGETAPGDTTPDTEPPPPPDPRSAIRPDPSGELPPEEVACRQRLQDLGVEFDNQPAESDPDGCSMPYPVAVKSLGSNIGLKPEAEMNCATAEASARLAKDVMAPAAQEVFGEALESITHASAYVCRPRNGTRKLSEHAFGNALDISSFTLSGGTTIAVELAPPEKNGSFVNKVRSAACGPFKTVLGPGSNADHAEHLHFDLARRRHGGTVCE